MDRLSDSADEIRLDLLREIEEANQRIEEQNKKAAVVGAEERKRLEKRIENEKEKLKILQKQVDPLEKQNTLAEEYEALQDSLSSSFTKLNIGARKLITTNKIGGTAFASLAKDILDLKEQQFGLSDDELKINQRKLEVYSNLYTSITDQAEEAAKTKDEMLGQNEAANRRLQFEESIANLGPEEQQKLKELFQLNENLIQQKERLNQIQEEGDKLYERLPGFLQDGVEDHYARAGLLHDGAWLLHDGVWLLLLGCLNLFLFFFTIIGLLFLSLKVCMPICFFFLLITTKKPFCACPRWFHKATNRSCGCPRWWCRPWRQCAHPCESWWQSSPAC